MESANHPHAHQGVLHKPWEHTALKVLSFGGLTTAALALAPVLFSHANGSLGMAATNAITFCTTGEGGGLAAAASSALSAIPVIGKSIALGGLDTALASGGLAIGGMWLANYIDKRTPEGAFRWGAVIRWASLATSILIALPAILPAISMGVMFIGTLIGSSMLPSIASAIGSLGSAGAMSGVSAAMGAAGLAGIHALTCALPLGVTGLFLGQKEEPKKNAAIQPLLPLPQLQLPALRDGRVMQLQQRLQAAV